MSAIRAWVRRKASALILVAIVLCVSGASLLWNVHQQGAFTAAQAREQAVQRQQGQALERKLCQTFGTLAALKPPPGDPRANPSRAYEQEEHATLVQLGTDLGCP